MQLPRTIMLAAALAATGTAGAQTPGAPPPPPPHAERQAELARDLTLLLGLADRQQGALRAFLDAAAPPPPRDRGPGDRAGAPPPPPPPAGFLQSLDGPDRRAEAEDARRQARIAAGRSFWDTLDAGQRARLDALTRLHALPFGGPPKGPPKGPLPRP